jgi:hypothetical protein
MIIVTVKPSLVQLPETANSTGRPELEVGAMVKEVRYFTGVAGC